MDGMLSQEEINALLGSIDNMDSSANGTASSSSDSLTADEKDAVGEISNISMGTAATTLSTLVNNKVVITTPVVSYSTWDNLSQEFGKPCVFIQIS
ncbi:MAG TPA: flagellar motor switch phosphatase FliY, partial [Lachnospiraceae bacterium]|nr:flagellar motor switch phosphatase FliY [Lachnospiraceae bacterium]